MGYHNLLPTGKFVDGSNLNSRLLLLFIWTTDIVVADCHLVCGSYTMAIQERPQIPMTRAGKERLEEELAELKGVRRMQIAEELKEAISHGDLRENAGYDEAKRAQAMLEIRVKEIEADLANSVLIENMHSRAGTVTVGVTVVVQEQGGGIEESFRIVGKTEADPAKGMISNESPLAQALLGKSAGDQADFTTPTGHTTRFNILRVEP